MSNENLNTAKVQLNQFGSPSVAAAVPVTLNDQTFYVYPLIPYESVCDAIQEGLDTIITDRGFIDAAAFRVIQDLLIVKYWTNIDITLDIDNPHRIFETYDIVKSLKLLYAFDIHLNADQIKFFREALSATLDSIMTYRNSAAGIVELLSQNAQSMGDSFIQTTDFLKDETKLQNLLKFAEIANADNQE